MQKNSKITKLIIIVLFIFILMITGFSIFLPVNFMAVSNWLPPLSLLGCSLGIIIIIIEIINFLKKYPNISRILKYILFIFLLILQLYASLSFIDYGRADSFYVHNQSYLLAHGYYHWQKYFKIYPNNVFCTIFLSFFIKLSMVLHLHSPWILINLIQFTWLDFGLISLLYLLKKQNLNYLCSLAILIWILTIPFYSYALFVYTDIWVLPVPLMVVAILITKAKSKTKRIAKIISICILLIFAAKMKSNFWILIIAFFLGIFIYSLQNHNFNKLKHYMISFLIILIIFNIGINLLNKQMNYQLSEQKLPITHWISMSYTPQTHGDYIKKQTLKDINLPTVEEREKNDINQLKNHFQQMKISGTIQHILKKFQLLTSSGTFDYQRLTKQWKVAPKWYYRNKILFTTYLPNILQICYITLLIGTLLFLITTSLNEINLILSLFIIGLILFHTVLWESEERYGLPILPIIILFGLLGFDNLTRKIEFPYKIKKIILLIINILIFGLIGKTILTLPINYSKYYITGQNIGSYLQNTSFELKPNNSLTTTIYVPINSNTLTIDLPKNQYTYSIKAEVTQNGKNITKCSTVKQLTHLDISKAQAGNIKIVIYNPNQNSIIFYTGESAYSIAKSPIYNYCHTYLQYQIYKNF